MLGDDRARVGRHRPGEAPTVRPAVQLGWTRDRTEGGRLRDIPLTLRLAKALREHRHLRSPLVLCNEDGEALKRRAVRVGVRRTARRAQVQNDGVRVLRHTICSYLAMRGAPARATQELAGHANLSTTQRYMHLSPAAIERAIRLLDQPSPDLTRGDILETADR